MLGKALAYFFPSTRIVNVTHVNKQCVMNLCHAINKERLNTLFPESNLNTRFVACRLEVTPTPERGFSLPITEKKLSILFWASGKVVLLGCNRTDHVLQCARIAYRVARPSFHDRLRLTAGSERVLNTNVITSLLEHAPNRM